MFLRQFLECDFRFVMTPEIKEECDKHQVRIHAKIGIHNDRDEKSKSS